MFMAHTRFPIFPTTKIAAVLTALAFLAGCSSPKPAAVSTPSPVPSASPAVVQPSATIADHAAKNPDSDKKVDKFDPYVAAVRASTMSGYPAATIGKAFEIAFHNAQWRSRQTKEGGRVVDFTGTLPANLRQDCFASKDARTAAPCAQDARVTFQWTFNPDGRLFHLSYIDPEPWPVAYRSTREMLLYIFE